MEQVSISNLLAGLPTEPLTEAGEASLTATVRKFKAGAKREAALETLILGNMRDAFFYSRRCAYNKLPDDEVFSICYAALSRAAVRFDPKQGRFFAYCKPYLRGSICRAWRSKDAVRNGGRTESLDHTPDVDDEPLAEENAIDPEFGRIDINEKWELVKPLLTKLSEAERRVLELHYNGGMNFQEIGELLGVTRSATQGTHKRALRKVRNSLLRNRKLYV
jgi:RNA polymerase sigma factor (sigma-70 family)